MLSAIVVALTGYVLINANGRVDAALAGFALTFSLNIANDVCPFLQSKFTILTSLILYSFNRYYSSSVDTLLWSLPWVRKVVILGSTNLTGAFEFSCSRTN